MTRDDALDLLELAAVDPIVGERLLSYLRNDRYGVAAYRRAVVLKLSRDGMRKQEMVLAMIDRLGISQRHAYRLLEDD